MTAYFGVVSLGVIWGLAFVAIRQADLELSPVNLALLRWFIASMFFLVLVPAIGRPKTRLERKDVPRLLAVAFTIAAENMSLYYAETTVSAGLAGLLISFGPVFAVILSALLLNERTGPLVLLALLLAVMGSLVLSIGSIRMSDLGTLYGSAAVVFAATFYGLFSVLGKPLTQKYGSQPTTIWSVLLGTVMMLPLLSSNFVSQTWSLSLDGWISVLYLSVISTVLAYLLFFTLVTRSTVSRLSIQLYLVPIVNVIGGTLLLHEQVTILTVGGGVLMLGAVALVTRMKSS